MKYLIDTSQIIAWFEEGTLVQNFDEMDENGDEVWITPDVHAELNGQLDDEQRIEFEKLYKNGVEKGYIIDSHHKYRIRKPYKTLAQDLRKEKVRIERTDRNLIALSFQIKGRIKTTDPGIAQALDILKTANGPWKKYALSIEKEFFDD